MLLPFLKYLSGASQTMLNMEKLPEVGENRELYLLAAIFLFFLLITNIRHSLERLDIQARFVHQPIKQLERPVIRLFHAARAGIPKGAFNGA